MESERRAKQYEQMRRTSFKLAREMVNKNPDISETIFEQIPAEKKKEIVRRISVHKKPAPARSVKHHIPEYVHDFID